MRPKRVVNKIIVCILGFAVVSSLAGCMAMSAGYALVRYPPEDVSWNCEMWGGFEPQGTYELLMDVFIQREFDRGWILVLTTHEGSGHSGYWCGPPSVSAFTETPKQWPNVQGVVRKGTLIRACRAMLWPGPECEGITGTVEPVGEILEGPFRGKIVMLSDLRDFGEIKTCGTFLLSSPHPELLCKVDGR